MTDQNEENECARDGVRYVFMAQKTNCCDGCAGKDKPLCFALPHCFSRFRKDKITGIWARKEPQQ